jgi:acyl-CoA thioesterase FadM
MNLYLRLLWTLLAARFGARLGLLDRCRTRFRTSLFDLDIFRHMNNGRYFTLQDLGRVDLMIRNGTLKVMKARGWYPVVVAESLSFRRSLELFDAFEIESQVIGWTERHFVIEHVFTRRGEQVAAGYVTARFLRKAGGTVPVAEVLDALDLRQESPPMPERVLTWLEAQNAITAAIPRQLSA